MTRRALTLAGIFILIAVLAFALRDMVEAVIIVPLAYLWWLLKLYYASIPQFIYWGLLTFLAFYSAVTNLIPNAKRRAAPREKIFPARGRIETLADLLQKSARGGTYYKWLIANRLGKDAREILAQREGNSISNIFNALKGRGWNPPPKIKSYLDVGLNSSFAEFPRKDWFWESQPPTPLDVEIQQVIDYLEDEMEMEHGRDHKSI